MKALFKTKKGFSNNTLAGLGAAALIVIAGATTTHASVIDLGASYTPTGADYTIFAVQGIDGANPLGVSSQAAHVNLNFEFTGGIGVNYVNSTGGYSQGGIGFYNNGPTSGIHSNGLNVQYNSLVTASSVTITVEDFDINKNTAWGPTGKARPDLTLFGAGGTIIGTADPSQILGNLQSTGKSDVWNVNLGSVLATLGQGDQAISGYLLSAPNFSGATFQGPTTDDPYFLVNAGSGNMTSVPETSALWPLLGVLGAIVFGPALRRKFTPDEAVETA